MDTKNKKALSTRSTTVSASSRNGPGPGRPTREQAEQRNFELLDKSLDLFLEKGYERTSIEEVAASVGMAKRTVYALHGNKKSLLMTALRRAIDNWIVPVQVLRDSESDDLEKSLLRIGKILLDNILTPQGLRLLRITNAESSHMPEISLYTYQSGTGPTLEYLTDLFVRRGPKGIKKKEAEEAALAFLYLAVGGPSNMVAWGIELDRPHLNRHIRYSVRIFLYGFLSDKPKNNSR